METNMTRKTRAAIAKYGEETCRRAYDWHVRLGYGASGIANEISGPVRTTRQADAAINAGCELADTAIAKATGGEA